MLQYDRRKFEYVLTRVYIPSYEPVWVHNIIYMCFMYERHNNTTCTFAFVFGYMLIFFYIHCTRHVHDIVRMYI